MVDKPKPIVGEEALKRMAGQALGQGKRSPPDNEETDPIATAQKTAKEIVALDIVSTEISKKKAEVREAEAKAAKAEAETAKVLSGETGAKASGIGVKITGDFDIQQLYAKQTADLQALTFQAQEQAASQAGISNTLREQLHAAQIETLKTGFTLQMENLSKMIEANASRGTFMDQYNVTKEFATQLGFREPGAASSDLSTTLELKRLDYEQSRENRRLNREEKAEERRWQLELRKLDDDREARVEDQKRQAKRDEMIANTPAMIGSAIAKGLMDRPAAGVSEGVKKRSTVEAGVGESGTVECSQCKKPVAIGPTARTADCAGCGAKYSIRRVASDLPAEATVEETDEE